MCTCGDCLLDCQESLPVVMSALIEASLQSRVGDFSPCWGGSFEGALFHIGSPIKTGPDKSSYMMVTSTSHPVIT